MNVGELKEFFDVCRIDDNCEIFIYLPVNGGETKCTSFSYDEQLKILVFYFFEEN